MLFLLQAPPEALSPRLLRPAWRLPSSDQADEMHVFQILPIYACPSRNALSIFITYGHTRIYFYTSLPQVERPEFTVVYFTICCGKKLKNAFFYPTLVLAS